MFAATTTAADCLATDKANPRGNGNQKGSSGIIGTLCSPEGDVPTYRIVWRDAAHKIIGMKDVDCSSDDEASAYAKQFVEGHDIERFEHGRFVTCFQSTDKDGS